MTFKRDDETHRGYGSSVVSCRLPLELKFQLETLSRERGMPISFVLKMYIEEAVRRNEPFWWLLDEEEESMNEPRRNDRAVGGNS